MAFYKVDPLKDARFPLTKPSVLGNAVSENVPEECIEELYTKLDGDKIFNNLCDIKNDLARDGQDNKEG